MTEKELEHLEALANRISGEKSTNETHKKARSDENVATSADVKNFVRNAMEERALYKEKLTHFPQVTNPKEIDLKEIVPLTRIDIHTNIASLSDQLLRVNRMIEDLGVHYTGDVPSLYPSKHSSVKPYQFTSLMTMSEIEEFQGALSTTFDHNEDIEHAIQVHIERFLKPLSGRPMVPGSMNTEVTCPAVYGRIPVVIYNKGGNKVKYTIIIWSPESTFEIPGVLSSPLSFEFLIRFIVVDEYDDIIEKLSCEDYATGFRYCIYITPNDRYLRVRPSSTSDKPPEICDVFAAAIHNAVLKGRAKLSGLNFNP